MKNIECEVTGISPLLQHRYPLEDAEEQVKTKSKSQHDGDVERSLYRLPDGTIYQPAIHFISAMKKAGSRYQIKGQGKATYRLLIGSGAVLITPDAIPHRQQKYEIDARPVVNPSTKGRIVRKRPCLTNWSLRFNIEYDEDDIGASMIHEILAYAGKRIGIGDFRPERGGPFGRFMITKFEEQ